MNLHQKRGRIIRFQRILFFGCEIRRIERLKSLEKCWHYFDEVVISSIVSSGVPLELGESGKAIQMGKIYRRCEYLWVFITK